MVSLGLSESEAMGMDDMMLSFERARAKALASGETLRYIELLERVVDAAVNYWAVSTPDWRRSSAQDAWNNLYDALTVLDWLTEDE